MNGKKFQEFKKLSTEDKIHYLYQDISVVKNQNKLIIGIVVANFIYILTKTLS